MDKLKNALRARLGDYAGKKPEQDGSGNVVYVPCEIFSDEKLEGFLEVGRIQAQCLASGTHYFQKEAFVFQAALVAALGAKALEERGREYVLSDDGIEFTPPDMAKMLLKQYHAELSVLNSMRG